MPTYNKIIMASIMFVEAHNKFVKSTSEIDYVTSIMLSGAVVGIIAPLLEEQGGHTTHSLLVRISNVMNSNDNEKAHIGIYKETYNGFKHAGNKRNKIKPSDNLEIETDLKLEAGRMLYAALSDFKEVRYSDEVENNMSSEFIQLMESSHQYV